MKVVVTGGAGFIGSHVVDAFLNRGDEVVIIDHWQKEKLRFVPEGVRVIKEAFASPTALAFIEEYQPDIICHLAAQISVPHSIQDPVYDAQTNIVDSVALLNAAIKARVRTFISTASCAIYGSSPHLPLSEEVRPQPETPYAISKLAFEPYLEFAHDMYGMQTISLRPANVYGPRQQTVGEAGVVAIFIEHILEGKQATIFGDGTATRDFIYVKDLARGFVCAAASTYHGNLNMSTETETSILNLWESLSAIHGQKTDVGYAEPRPGDIHRSCLTSEKALRVIGWKPEVGLQEGLRETYDWFKNKESL